MHCGAEPLLARRNSPPACHATWKTALTATRGIAPSSVIVGNDCAIEVDTNSYSVPWRLIGERVAVTIAAGEVRVRHGATEVAVHAQAEGRRQRITDRAHLDGVAGRDGPVCRAVITTPPIESEAPPPPALLRSLAEYEAIAGGPF